MFRVKQNRKKQIVSIEYEDIRAMNILCPRCFTEWRLNRGNTPVWVWLDNNLIGKTFDDGVKAPCGCYLPVWDIVHTSILVDEIIASPVSRINKAGYRTKYSCSGHLHDPHAYLNFQHTYDDLIDWITNNKYLSNVLSLEVEVHDDLNKDRTLEYIWNPEKGNWNLEGAMTHTGTLPLENMTIRLIKPGKLYNLGCMLLFRRLLIKVAKWCEKTQAYNAENNFKKKFLSRMK